MPRVARLVRVRVTYVTGMVGLLYLIHVHIYSRKNFQTGGAWEQRKTASQNKEDEKSGCDLLR